MATLIFTPAEKALLERLRALTPEAASWLAETLVGEDRYVEAWGADEAEAGTFGALKLDTVRAFRCALVTAVERVADRGNM